tara:strand:+ start:377 stop:691 length:315 start_codon:yes stop_codon:yes gene_type:complete
MPFDLKKKMRANPTSKKNIKHKGSNQTRLKNIMAEKNKIKLTFAKSILNKTTVRKPNKLDELDFDLIELISKKFGTKIFTKQFLNSYKKQTKKKQIQKKINNVQ